LVKSPTSANLAAGRRQGILGCAAARFGNAENKAFSEAEALARRLHRFLRNIAEVAAVPSVLPDLNIFPTRPVEPRQQPAARDREGPSRFESLVDESEPDTQAAGPQPSSARESKSSPPANSAEPAAASSENQATAPTPDAPPVEAPIPASDPATDFAAVTAALAAALGTVTPEADNLTHETTEGSESDADPAAIVVAAPAPEQPLVAAAITMPSPPVAPVVTAPVGDDATPESDTEGDIVENAGRTTSAPAIPADQLASLTRAAPKEAAPPPETGDDVAQTKSGEANNVAPDEARPETDIVLPTKGTLTSDEDPDADTKAEAPPAPPERTDGAKPTRTLNETALPVAAAEDRPAAQPSRNHALQPLVPAEHQSVAAQAHAQANAQAQARPIVQAVPVAAVPVEIAAQARAGKTSFEIRLDPPELGRIDVRLDIDHDGKVTSRLTVERAETLDVLRRDAHSIERALNDAGLKTSDNSLQFSLRDQGNAQRDQDDTGRAERLAVAETELAAQSAAPIYNRLAGLGGGLDIRV
jgi:flagellar hook-length control protein FliK